MKFLNYLKSLNQNQYDIAASERNLENQLELWDKTNYPAQVQQLQKAGLSVGLMYKGGGQSGQIAADNVNRQAPTAANGGGMEIQQMMQMILNNKMTEAQIENIKADTAGKEISNQNEGEGRINQTVKYATIDNLIANTTNTNAKTSLTNAQKTAQDLANGITEETMEATIGKAINEWKIGVNELYKSDTNTEWLKNNLPTAEQDFKNRLASSGIDNLLKSVQIGNVRQNTQEQLGLQSNLMEMQDQYNAKQTARNIQAQLDLWQKTNYPAQVEQLNKAGLNPALLYGKGGGGGTTAAANTVNNPAPTAQRPFEIQQLMSMALQNELQEAQIKNINADTKGKEISNTNEGEGGINQTVKYATIDNLIANTTNTDAKTSLTNAQKTAQDLSNGITEGTMEATIGTSIVTGKQIGRAHV